MYKIFFIFLGVTLGLFACSQKSYDVKYKKGDNPLYVKHPATKFAIMSDLHFYDTILGKDGKAFEDYIDNDRKLLIESEEILDKAIEKISAEDVDFVIIPGDLTKDGEEINHKKVAEKLAKLKQSGKKVFVINGNHDLLNGHSLRYVNDSKERVETTDREEFMEFYKDFGFGDAIDQDKESLSYVFEPVEGLWFLAMDSCMWYKNDLDEEPVVDGEFRQSTVTWIESVLQKANKENKALLGMMHHGALEHYNSNEKYYGEYVVNRNEEIIKLFAAYGLNFVFTGHFHSQDIVSKKLKNGSFLYDIETGSLVTHPCPYRIINISE
nr:metallophosphoesterase [Spirochaetota bacterium]